jgi:hypothetical protein
MGIYRNSIGDGKWVAMERAGQVSHRAVGGYSPAQPQQTTDHVDATAGCGRDEGEYAEMTQPPHDEPTATGPEELREQVERTRRELGDTVQELAGRTDVKARAQEKAAAVKGQMTALREQTAAKASELTGQARAKAAEATHALQDRLPEPVRDKAAAAAGQTRATADRAGQVWQDKASGPVRDNRAALITAGAALLVACVLLRRKKQ